MPGVPLVAEVRNPEGRIVWLDSATWNHVLEEHAEMDGFLTSVMNVVEAREHREPDPRPGRERYFRRAGPEVWLRVVVEFSGETDRVVTAFPELEGPTVRGRRR